MELTNRSDIKRPERFKLDESSSRLIWVRQQDEVGHWINTSRAQLIRL